MSGPLQFTKPFYDYIVNETAHFAILDLQQPSAEKEEGATGQPVNDAIKNLYSDVLKKIQEWANKPENKEKKKISDSNLSLAVLKRVQEAAKKYHFPNASPKL